MTNSGNTLRQTIRFRVLAALALATCLAACQPDEATALREAALLAKPGTPNLIGTPYAQALAGTIVRAERIVISQHADPFDGVDKSAAGARQPQAVVVYGEHELTQNQKLLLLDAILGMPASVHGAPPVGVFEARHTLSFYSEGRLLSTMALCFKCGQIRWQGGLEAPYPDEMLSTLKKAINNFGVTTDRDWDQYALAHGKSANK